MIRTLTFIVISIYALSCIKPTQSTQHRSQNSSKNSYLLLSSFDTLPTIKSSLKTLRDSIYDKMINSFRVKPCCNTLAFNIQDSLALPKWSKASFRFSFDCDECSFFYSPSYHLLLNTNGEVLFHGNQIGLDNLSDFVCDAYRNSFENLGIMEQVMINFEWDDSVSQKDFNACLEGLISGYLNFVTELCPKLYNKPLSELTEDELYEFSLKQPFLCKIVVSKVTITDDVEDLTISHQISNDSIKYTFIDSLLCDGFDFPVGNREGKGSYVSKTDGKTYHGWYLAVKHGEEYFLGTHPGEDWNGSGGGNTDLHQPVHSIGNGKVIEARDFNAPWGNIVYIQHRYLVNGQLNTCYSLYAHLDSLFVKKGDKITRRQEIGTIGTGGGVYPAHLHFEIRKKSMVKYAIAYWPGSDASKFIEKHYESPTKFINEHRKLTYPAKEEKILLAIKNKYEMYLYNNGKMVKNYEIALSQNPNGHKERQGDNKLPEGEYRIIQKSRGPFDGAWGDFFGPAWMRLNYPNNFDAKSGLQKKLISLAQKNAIINANNSGKWPPKNTALGGGIGIHGWSGEWQADETQNLTWGCISMHNKDLHSFFDSIPLNTKIVIMP